MDKYFEALEKAKQGVDLSRSFINQDQTAGDALLLDELEKGKAGQIGEIRTWGGKKYQKTAKGWRPVKKGTQPGGSKEEKPSMQKESSDKYEFVLRGKVDPVNDKDWEKLLLK